MPRQSKEDEIIAGLSDSISADAGNITDKDIDAVSQSFDQSLTTALQSFNSPLFDDDGFVRRMQDLDLGGSDDKDTVKNILNNVRKDYVGADAINQSELLLRRDLKSICRQMPEMGDVLSVIRDAIIECNVSTGEVSRSLLFENTSNSEEAISTTKSCEKRHGLLKAIKNFIVPNTLRGGEYYVQITPYSKLFAEIEALRDSKFHTSTDFSLPRAFHESCPQDLVQSMAYDTHSIYSKENVQFLMESAMVDDMGDGKKPTLSKQPDQKMADGLKQILENIEVYRGSSSLMADIGPDGFAEFVVREYAEDRRKSKESKTGDVDPARHFMENINGFGGDGSAFGQIDQDSIDIGAYKDIKGCYIKYLDPLRLVPIRIDRRIIGYYYVSTTMDLRENQAMPRGVIDMSFQNYMRDRGMVSQLATLIIQSFDRKMLNRNIRLKDEIAEIIMAHKFAEGKLSFIYIPETEIVRFVINEDEEGRGHSVIEPSLFPARMYIMLTMYNMLYVLNNNTTRIHYVRSSGLNKNYAAQIQRTMRKFQSRRVSIDDIYSYNSAMNKIGGMGEMVLPIGRNDYKALETDTIEAVQNPINVEFIEQQRRQANSGTGVPHLMMINAIDEADFAKTLEMANARFLSTVSSLKIDFNEDLTTMYQRILQFDTEMEKDVIQAFRFQFNPAKQQEMAITAEMISNFQQIYEAVSLVYYSKKELEDDQGNPTPTQRLLRKALAQKYLAQLEFDELDRIVGEVNVLAMQEQQRQLAAGATIDSEDLQEIDEET